MTGDRSVYGQRFAASLNRVTGEEGVYACPLCLTRVNLDEIESLTWDHYPPQSIGGRNGDTVLVCEECRNRWSNIDVEVGHLRDAQEYNRMYPGTMPGVQRFPDTPSLSGSTQRVAFSVILSEKSIEFRIIPRLDDNPAQATAYIAEQIQKIVANKGRLRLKGSFRDKSYSDAIIALAFLKAAYLAAFDCLGYRFILAPALETVRQQMLQPNEDILMPPVLAVVPQSTEFDREIVVGYLTDPAPVTSLTVLFRGYKLDHWVAVFLPLPARNEPLNYEYLHYMKEQIDSVELRCSPLDRTDPNYITARDIWITDESGRRRSYYYADVTE